MSVVSLDSGIQMSDASVVVAIAMIGGVAITTLCLVFLFAIYIASGRQKDHLEVAGDALPKVGEASSAARGRAKAKRRRNITSGEAPNDQPAA
jgi:hypothetical protein